jgi:hypothetical protein
MDAETRELFWRVEKLESRVLNLEEDVRKLLRVSDLERDVRQLLRAVRYLREELDRRETP